MFFLKSISLNMRFLVPVLLVLLSSCTKEVKIDIPEKEKQLVVDGRIETNGFPIVFLTQSQYLYDPANLGSYLNSNVTTALVKVSNGTDTITLSLYSPNQLPLESQITLAEMLNLEVNEIQILPIAVYSTENPIMKGTVGKKYELVIIHENKIHSGTTQILNPVPLAQTQWIPDLENSNYGLCKVFLNDPCSEKNAYRWESKLITAMNGLPKDIQFRHGGESYFSDQFFNGLSISFETRYPKKDTTYPSGYKRHFKLGDSLVIRFSNIESPVYNFFDKRLSQIQSNNSPFASPVQIPSNVSNTLGIWAAYSTWYDTLYCVP